MATPEELAASLEHFRSSFNDNERLRVMSRDWNRIIHVQATDLGTDHTLEMREGELFHRPETPATADIVLRGPSETLTDMFYGDISPTQPYMDGTLVVQGSQEDIIRLDFISLMIWGD